MTTPQWTSSQQDAIHAKGGTLLVSAAAGSGKTAVLVQRVIEKLCDEQHPVDADRLLVVTFTNAAAGEMKARIAAELARKMEENPFHTHLQRQQVLLANAHISTIDSFCRELVREHFSQLNIAPDFRIADESEMVVLRANAMQQTLESFYEEGEAAFLALVDLFGSGKDDRRFAAAVETLYRFTRAHPFPQQWLEHLASLYETEMPMRRTVWGEVLFDYLKDALDYAIHLTNASLQRMREDAAVEQAYRPAVLNDFMALRTLASTLQEGSWDEVVQAVAAFEFVTLKAIRGQKDNPVKLAVGQNRDEVKSLVKKCQKLFCCTEAEGKQELAQMKPLVCKLCEVTRAFAHTLDQLKAQKKVADFGDLEHLTLKLLVAPAEGGFTLTPEALALRAQFDEVLVDECQDINEAQDLIFRALSQEETNLFLVGDVKQSIYRFRLAMPELFLRRRESYTLYRRESPRFPACILLGQNFRSQKGILESVNFVFRQLMSKQIGEMEYGEEEELKAGRAEEDAPSPGLCLHILDAAEAEEQDTNQLEARYLANLIQEKISSGELIQDHGMLRPVTYRDFCILLRHANRHAPSYAKELQLAGIPAYSDAGGRFFGTPEVAMALSLLRVIDNPIQDIPLLSLLMSPLYGFTPDDISTIRLSQTKAPLYFALKTQAQRLGQNSREQLFLHQMETFRTLASTMPAEQLIRFVFQKTGFFAMVQAMKQGNMRLQNLYLLLSYARTYQQSGQQTLAGFLRFVERLEEEQSDLRSSGGASDSSNVVRIMSIHRSKGLEFPICILAGCARRHNKEKGDVLLHTQLGAGFPLKDESGVFVTPTVPYQALSLELEKGTLSEEMRVLYVALTRAKEQLYVLTTLKHPQRALQKLAQGLGEGTAVPPYVVRSALSFSDWLLCAALRHPDAAALRMLAGVPELPPLPCAAHWQVVVQKVQQEVPEDPSTEEAPAPPVDEELLALLQQRLQYRYPYESVAAMPSKVTASSLAAQEHVTQFAFSERPAFLQGDGLTPMERGNALHHFMQFADFHTPACALQQELDRLVAGGFLSGEEAQAVDLEKARAFYESTLMKRILASKELHREYTFTVMLPVSNLAAGAAPEQGEEMVVLQGAADCVFWEEDGYVIVDYKTDRAKDIDSFVQKYQTQLRCYQQAVERCTGKRVKECLLYSFALSQAVSVPLLPAGSNHFYP